MALITPTQVIEIAFTNRNTDKYLIKPAFVKIAELNSIQPNIGEKLYEKISNEVNSPVIWRNDSTIVCQAASVALNSEYLTLYSNQDENKYAVYFQYTSADLFPIPSGGYTGVIIVDLTTAGVTSTATEVSTALSLVLNTYTSEFIATSTGVNVEITALTQASSPTKGTTQFNILGITCVVTSGSTTITVAANSFIKVGDFISGTEIPINSDTDNSGFSKVETVDTPGAVTSFTISGTPTATNATASLTFRRPNGVLNEDYILNYLAFSVKFEVLPDITYNTTSQGVVGNVADFTLPVEAKTLSFMRTETYKKSETFLKSLHDFVCENEESYPDYCNPNAGGVYKSNGIILY